MQHVATESARAGRPHGKRFGVLVHAVLATVDSLADPEQVARVARAEGRLVSASVEEIDAAAGARSRGAPPFPVARAARASTCRRESPVLLALGDGSFVEGVLDMAFREVEDDGAVWTVVDFKTDVEIAGRKVDYERQIDLYCAQSPRRPVNRRAACFYRCNPMPELPEVEFARGCLERWLGGEKLARVEADRGRVTRGTALSAFEALAGHTVKRVERRGKWLLWQFEDGTGVLAHLGMTGKFEMTSADAAPRSSRFASCAATAPWFTTAIRDNSGACRWPK